jgi:GT2 family glycosyltransferase
VGGKVSDQPAAQNYLFRFDAPLESRIFGETCAVGGWLLERSGKPIHGIRTIVRSTFRRRETVPARRKRERRDVAGAFPDLPGARDSGFLLELGLGLGRNHLTLQVRGEDRVWRTFHTAVIWAWPLSFLKSLRLVHLHRVLISFLQQLFPGKREVHETLDALRQKPPGARSSRFSQKTNRLDLFATSRSNLFILEIGELIAAGFRELGCPAQMRLDEILPQDPPAGTVPMVVTPHEYYNLFLREKMTQEEAESLTSNAVLLCTEQPETGWFYSNLPWAISARATVDINPLGVAAYCNHGVPARHFQLGYHPMLSAPAQPAYAERNFDITFLGSMTPRRDRFFAEHAPFFAQHRCHLRFVPLGFAKTRATRSYLSAAQRNELLSQSRIFLNLHYAERKYCEWHRMLVGLANGCCIISETSEGHGPLVPGRHFVMADEEDLIACCEYYLNRPAEAEAIARAGRVFVEKQLRQSFACRKFLEEMDEPGLANADGFLPATVPDATPEALPIDLRRKFSARVARQFKRALRDDVNALFGRETVSFPPQSEPREIVDDAASQRSTIMQKREAYEARWMEQEARRTEGGEIWTVHDNEPYRASPPPAVTVLITLFNYGHYLAECLASVGRASALMREPLEIVIVNDASTDDSLGEARRLQARLDLPIRIVDKQFNTGLADARNVGVQLARAPYVFIMDADNLIFPNGLSQLLEAIENEQSVAAYSLLCRFRGDPSHRVGLLSYYDWDPQILVQHPYIDAMALFRRDALLEDGGYDNRLNQVGWFGWEDYDMWLRFASRQQTVAFVPNILCLYRHHDTSMINITNLFERDLVLHLHKRYGALVDQFEPRATIFGVERTRLNLPEVSEASG